MTISCRWLALVFPSLLLQQSEALQSFNSNFILGNCRYASTAFSDRNFLGSRIKHDGTVGE